MIANYISIYQGVANTSQKIDPLAALNQALAL